MADESSRSLDASALADAAGMDVDLRNLAEAPVPESGHPLQGLAPAGRHESVLDRLVHLYWDVDDVRVHDYLNPGIDELARFGETIARHEW